MSMNILAMNSSHRKNGCTKRALDIFLEEFEQEAAIERIDLIDLNIGYCRGCWFCRQTDGSCMIKDDMQALCESYIKADIIVLGAPVYYNCVTSVLKTVIDRSVALHFSDRIKQRNRTRKKMVVLSPGAGEYRNQYDAFPSVLEFYIQDLNADLVSFVQMPKLGLSIDADIEKYRKDIMHAVRKCLK